jgi:hypothetical protein
MYCEDLTAEQRSSPTSNVLTRCPKEWGTLDYDEVSGMCYISFTMTCGDETMLADLAEGVLLTAPNSTPMSAEDFEIAFGGIIPEGTFVEFAGDLDEVAWNCYRFGRNTLSFVSTSGDSVHAAVRDFHGGPPVALLAVNDVLIETRAVPAP